MQRPSNTTERLRLRQAILGAFCFMMVGTSTELYLLDHYEDTQQLIPLLCIGVALVMVIVLWVTPRNWAIRVFQVLMGLTALSGVYGVFLHLQANYDFEREMKPTATHWESWLESLSGALPALAPGSMIALALVGYASLLLLKRNR